MNLKNIMLIVILASSCVVASSAQPPLIEWNKTQETKFPILPTNDDWYFYGTAKNSGDSYWVYGRDFDVKAKVVTVWCRTYKYSENCLLVYLMKMNKETKEYKMLSWKNYSLTNGNIVSSSNGLYEPKWKDAMPGSMPDSLFGALMMLEYLPSH